MAAWNDPTRDPEIQAFFASLGEPQYSSADNDPEQSIILFGMLRGSKTPFIASPTDAHDYGRDFHQRANDGEFGPIAPFAGVEPTDLFGKGRL
jgi:hypothetical protein